MPINVHDAEPQREIGEVIPDGTFVRVVMHIIPGGADVVSGDPAQDALDAGLFKQSESSDAKGLDVDLAVLWPHEYEKRKIFNDKFWTITGGKVDSKGVSAGWGMTKSRIRAAINSCMGLDPNDRSPRAAALHTIGGFKELDGLEFFARLSVVPGDPAPNGGTYPDKNGLYHIVEPGEPEYAALAQRQEVPPQPVNLKPKGRPATATAGAAAAPGAVWGGGAPTTQPAPTRTWGAPAAPAQTVPATAVAVQQQQPNGADQSQVSQPPATQPAAPATQRPRWATGG